MFHSLENKNNAKKGTGRTKSKKDDSKYYETSVRKQGDRLLKDMLQLRKDIENFKEHPEDNSILNVKNVKETYLPVASQDCELEKNEENILRERLEMMTLQIKQELEEELLREESRKDQLGNKPNEDDDTKIKKFFQKLVSQNDVESNESLENAISKKSESIGNEAINLAIQNLLELDDEPKSSSNFTEISKEDRHYESKGRRPSVKVDTLKRKGKTKKKSQSKPQIVEIPFCSHNQHSTGQETTVLPDLEKDQPKHSMNTILSPDEQLGAEEILRELIEIRDGGKSEKNPVLDTMIR